MFLLWLMLGMFAEQEQAASENKGYLTQLYEFSFCSLQTE